METTTVHLAANAIMLGYQDEGDARCIQRCAVCGEKLVDFHLRKENGAIVLGHYWPAGTLVRIDSEGSGEVIEELHAPVIEDIAEVPEDFCLDLVEY